MKYELPENVVHLEVHYLHDKLHNTKSKPVKANKAAYQDVDQFHQMLKQNADLSQRKALFSKLVKELGDDGVLNEESFLYSSQSWDLITDYYRRYSRDPSFVDYFWTVKLMHAPIWILNGIAEQFIPCKMYHTISTGYAGFMGAMLKRQTGRPLLLSEHGIYTKERKIDLFQSEWISDNRGIVAQNNSEMEYFREKWANFFVELGRECYNASDKIVALYERNRLRQVSDGAPTERTLNIPNGIDLPRMEKVRANRPEQVPAVCCLLGRVVPIKDVKTYIRAMRTVVNKMPHAEGWIAGPEDEDQAYADDCHALVRSLGLEDNVKFLGFQKIDELLPKVGVIVLSSISEALPLSILEGFAAGVPAISTDVGSCRQLIEGLSDEDKALGSAGNIVGIADPEALGGAVVNLLSDNKRWHQAQQSGIARVSQFYTQDMMFAAYRDLYQQLLADH